MPTPQNADMFCKPRLKEQEHVGEKLVSFNVQYLLYRSTTECC